MDKVRAVQGLGPMALVIAQSRAHNLASLSMDKKVPLNVLVQIRLLRTPWLGLVCGVNLESLRFHSLAMAWCPRVGRETTGSVQMVIQVLFLLNTVIKQNKQRGETSF